MKWLTLVETVPILEIISNLTNYNNKILDGVSFDLMSSWFLPCYKGFSFLLDKIFLDILQMVLTK